MTHTNTHTLNKHDFLFAPAPKVRFWVFWANKGSLNNNPRKSSNDYKVKSQMNAVAKTDLFSLFFFSLQTKLH